jgi:ferredoxin
MSHAAVQLIRLTPEKFPENEPGQYSVNTECIDCDLCRQIAPANFTREMTDGHSYVYQQPENARQEQQCREALETCPVGAIEAEGI